MKSETDAPPKPAGFGIHVSRGVTVQIPAGALVIKLDPSGNPTPELNAIHVQLNTCTDWLEIAMDHLAASEHAHAELLKTHGSGANIGDLLQPEFKAAMQAIVAAATFFEALYAATRERLPAALNAPRPQGRKQSSRSAMVTEQLKRAFHVKNRGVKNLRTVLKDVYHYRDEAVHPSAAFGPPVLHPDLGVGVERRFVMYRYENARQLVRAALAFCKLLASQDMSASPKGMQDLASYLLTTGAPLFEAWESRYGALCG
jgi:hypothetical protein